MIKIPKFYYRISMAGTVKTKQISASGHGETWKIHPMFLKGNVQVSDNNLDSDFNDYYWISQFEPSNNNQSIPGATVQVSLTRAAFRQSISAIGVGWSQNGIAEWAGLQLLFEIVMATHNSQSVLSGNQSGVVTPTGLTTGAVSSCVQISNTAMSFYGIENLTGNRWKFIDGININSTNAAITPYVTTDITKYADDAEIGIKGNPVPNVSGFIQKMQNNIGTQLGWFDFPALTGGSATTFYCDYLSTSMGWKVVAISGYYGNDSTYGMWFFDLAYDSGGAHANITSRLSFRPY